MHFSSTFFSSLHKNLKNQTSTWFSCLFFISFSRLSFFYFLGVVIRDPSDTTKEKLEEKKRETLLIPFSPFHSSFKLIVECHLTNKGRKAKTKQKKRFYPYQNSLVNLKQWPRFLGILQVAKSEQSLAHLSHALLFPPFLYY